MPTIVSLDTGKAANPIALGRASLRSFHPLAKERNVIHGGLNKRCSEYSLRDRRRKKERERKEGIGSEGATCFCKATRTRDVGISCNFRVKHCESRNRNSADGTLIKFDAATPGEMSAPIIRLSPPAVRACSSSNFNLL